MQSWEKQFSPKEISEIASYVKSLKGTKPATPKAPQGDLYVETGITDSTTSTAPAVNTDSSIAKKTVK